ncbi:c-type cytochrome [Flavihumibacter fluvii]|uniref:c-type cytochrome n=1 Tax=Flavihumibacter fluvii TaxID=2838157 RepID=UPI001BDE4584|nr:cytochrome c [Flavihumibacter fluvii]ULQ53052.1 cytochrome c [Flavihumibacter fluvii]
MKKYFLLVGLAAIFYACGGENKESKNESPAATEANPGTEAAPVSEKGIGKFDNIKIEDKLDAAMAQTGEAVYDVKCSSCHKLTDEKLVGPGWKDVTQRHKPEWIMNFVTNVEEMLNKDPKAQAQLEICLVRMPNQNLTDDDARHVYEFMRKNDGVK